MRASTQALLALCVVGGLAFAAGIVRQRGYQAAPKALDLDRLQVAAVEVVPWTPSPSPRGEELFRALPATDEPGGPWGGPFRLERKVDQIWDPLAPGFAGLLGASFDASADGRTLWLAREDEGSLERWDLVKGERTSVAVGPEPGIVALAPGEPERVAYSLGGEEGDRLFLLENNTPRQIYPPKGTEPVPGLGLEWAPDGRTILLRWEERDAKEVPTTKLVWLRPDGQIGLQAAVAAPLLEVEPAWVEGGGLAVGEDGWLWRAGEPKALALGSLGGVWGLDPSGRLAAGLQGDKLVLLALAKPEQRYELGLKGLPAGFEAGSLAWRRDANGDLLAIAGEQASRLLELRIRLKP